MLEAFTCSRSSSATAARREGGGLDGGAAALPAGRTRAAVARARSEVKALHAAAVCVRRRRRGELHRRDGPGQGGVPAGEGFAQIRAKAAAVVTHLDETIWILD